METIVDTIEHQTWTLNEWRVKFLLSERQLQLIRKTADSREWYEDPAVFGTWQEKLQTCFTSIKIFYESFGLLPQIGDRLYDESSGLMIQDRSIDGNMKTITFVLTI